MLHALLGLGPRDVGQRSATRKRGDAQAGLGGVGWIFIVASILNRTRLAVAGAGPGPGLRGSQRHTMDGARSKGSFHGRKNMSDSEPSPCPVKAAPYNRGLSASRSAKLKLSWHELRGFLKRVGGVARRHRGLEAWAVGQPEPAWRGSARLCFVLLDAAHFRSPVQVAIPLVITIRFPLCSYVAVFFRLCFVFVFFQGEGKEHA